MQDFMQLLEANWPIAVAIALLLLLVLWWIILASRKTRVETDRSDVLDEGKGPSQRNQALIDAPPAAAAAITPEVAPEAVPVAQKSADGAQPASQATGASDDLTRIKGVGPKLQTLLNSLGVSSFSQIAAWSDADIDAIDAKLGKFEGRIRRDSWVEQAKLLSSGDTAAYESQFGKL